MNQRYKSIRHLYVKLYIAFQQDSRHLDLCAFHSKGDYELQSNRATKRKHEYGYEYDPKKSC